MSHSFQRSRIVLATSLGVLLASAAKPQEQDLGGTFFETVDVQIVNVDVIVTSDSGEPVMDLKAEDFAVFEDGQPMEIVNFLGPLDAHSTRPSVQRSTQPALGAPQRPPLTLAVFFDSATLMPGSRRRIAKEIDEFFEEALSPRDQIVILAADSRVEVVQEPTNDREAISRSLNELSKRSSGAPLSGAHFRRAIADVSADPGGASTGGAQSVPRGLLAQTAYQAIRTYAAEQHSQTLRTVAAMKDALGAFSVLPGPKALLYVGTGLTASPAQALMNLWRERFLDMGVSAQFDHLRTERLDFDATAHLRQLADTAAGYRIMFYTLMPPDSITGFHGVELRGIDAEGNRTWTAEYQSMEIVNRFDNLQHLARTTGGLAAQKGAADLMSLARRDFDTLYSLAYRRPEDSPSSGSHAIRVEVTRPGVALRYRHNYRNVTLEQRMMDRTRSALLLAETTNPMGIGVEFGVDRGQEDEVISVPVVVKIPMSQLTLLPDANGFSGRLSLYVGAQDSEGRITPISRDVLPLQIPRDELQAALARVGGYQFTLQLRREEHLVAVGIRDELGNQESIVRALYSPRLPEADS